MNKTVYVVFCSPAGSTKHVAGIIGEEFERQQADVRTLDLGKEKDWSSVEDRFNSSCEETCLFIGSPVYRDLAAAPVMRFIEALPTVEGCPAVPFVTWGGACSGIALWQMGQALQSKGFVIAGAAKVLGVHSLMWQTDAPLGNGHPDAADDKAVKDLVKAIATKQWSSGIQPLSSHVLDYHPPSLAQEMKTKIGKPSGGAPRVVDEEICTQCEICIQECPTDAITLNPFPEFGEGCIDCFNCIRSCPEHAIEPTVTLGQIEQLIRKRSETINEHPHTQVFV